MATEEQRRAFAEYMGTTAAASNNQAGQQAQQPGAQQALGLQNPYGGLGGMQGVQNPYAGQQYPGYNPVRIPPVPFLYPMALFNVIPARPSNTQQFAQAPPAAPSPPAAPGALATSQQLAQLGASMPPAPRPPGYVDLPRTYGAPQQQHQAPRYNAGWPYNTPTGPMMPQQQQGVGHGAMAPQANAVNQHLGQMIESKDQYPYRYEGVWPPPDVIRPPEPPQAPSVPLVEPELHVLLCHVCSSCGRMRSAGFHRHHPVIPGQPAVQTPCRRCKHKAKKEREKRETRHGSRTIHISIDEGEGRGRARGRDEVYARRRSSPSPRRTIVRSRSRANIGIRVLRETSPPSVLRRTRTEVRVASASPPANVRVRRHRSDEVYLAPDPPPAHRPRQRYAEPSPSPPPVRRRSTRVEYREESLERPPVADYQPRGPSPVPVYARREHRERDAESRLAAHPAPFRSVTRDHRAYMRQEDESTSTESPARVASPRRGILRNPDANYETTQRRHMRETYDSMLPEVSGGRVQFAVEPVRHEHREEADSRSQHVRRRSRNTDGEHCSTEDYTQHHRRTERRYVENPRSPSPPAQGFSRLRVRDPSPPPRAYDQEVRVRHISPDPPRRYDEVRVRHMSPRNRTQQTRPASPEEPRYATYRTVECARSPSPNVDPRHEDWDDVTESGSEGGVESETVQVTQYRALDENGRPATYVEERTTRRAPALPQTTGPFLHGPPVPRGYVPVRDV